MLALLEIVIKIMLLITQFGVEVNIESIYHRIHQLAHGKMQAEKSKDITVRPQDSDRNFLTAQGDYIEDEDNDTKATFLEVLKTHRKEIHQHLHMIFGPSQDPARFVDVQATAKLTKEFLMLYTIVPGNLRCLLHKLMPTAYSDLL